MNLNRYSQKEYRFFVEKTKVKVSLKSFQRLVGNSLQERVSQGENKKYVYFLKIL